MKPARVVALCLILVLAAGAAFAGGQTEKGKESAATGSAPMGKEAPEFAAMVKAGLLPPVEQRLPVNPVVVQVVDGIGRYGGTARAFTKQLGVYGDGELLIPREPPLRLGQGGETVEPNLIESWEFSPDGKVFTFKLLEGVRWSDGEPLTTEGIRYWWEDVIGNKDLTPVVPQWLKPGGVPAKLTILDEWSVRMEFAVPNPMLTVDLAFWAGVGVPPLWAKHWLSQFHPKYTPKAELDARVKEYGFDSWVKLHGAMVWNQRGMMAHPAPEKVPVLQPYVVKEVNMGTATLVRNPYYWKVDPAGNQLPYIEQIIVTKVEDAEVQDLKRIAGEADIGAEGFPLEKFSLLKENEDKGNYRTLMYNKAYGTECAFQLNQTYDKDVVLRDIFRDVRFRKAMSLALNREEINQLIYRGLAEPVQTTVHPVTASRYYEEEFGTAYTEHDPAAANRLLDEMGLRRGTDGIRIRPDGKKLEILLEYFNEDTPKRQIVELAKKHWADVGVKVDSREVTGALVTQKAVGNEMQMGLWHGNRSTSLLVATYPYWYVPVLGWEKTWCPLWAHWYATEGAQGEEPPAMVKKAIDVRDRMLQTMNEDERTRLGKELLKINAENLWTIGTVRNGSQPLIVRKNLRNLPDEGYIGWDVFQLDTYHPEQFYFEN